MQQAELRLLAASLGGEPAPGAPPVLPKSNADIRLMEIRQLRRDDAWAYESNAALQKEELGLIEAQLAAQRPAEMQQSSEPAVSAPALDAGAAAPAAGAE